MTYLLITKVCPFPIKPIVVQKFNVLILISSQKPIKQLLIKGQDLGYFIYYGNLEGV